MGLPWCFIFMDASVHMHGIYQADMGANCSVTCRDEDCFRGFSRAVFTVNDQTIMIIQNKSCYPKLMVSIYILCGGEIIYVRYKGGSQLPQLQKMLHFM